ncbi:MAG: hypothetical protein AAF329_26670 [Cyanobacteria bacterium P01_A01_bin.17]
MSISRSPGPFISWSILLVLASLLSGCSAIAQRQAANEYLKATIVPGVGLGDLQIRKTTLGEIVNKLGRNYKREVKGGYLPEDCQIIDCPPTQEETKTIVLHYKAQGFKFFFEQQPNQGLPEDELLLNSIYIECVQKRCPFKGETEQGIRLGDTRAEVKEVYGQPNRTYTNSWLMSYPSGISFLVDHPYLEPIKESDLIEGITIPDRT